MPIPEFFKYDIRVRARMLKRGALTEGELGKHVDALADVSEQVIEVELKQPALQKESERVERVVTRAAARSLSQVPPVRSLENELNDIEEDEDDDLDDEDDDDDDVKVKAKAADKAKAEEKPKAEPAPAPAPEAKKPDAGDAEESEA